MTELPFEIPLAGLQVSKESESGNDLTLVFAAAEGTELSFDRRVATVTPPVEDFVGRTIRSARCSANVLEVVFDDEMTLLVQPADAFEAWQVVTPSEMFVGSPRKFLSAGRACLRSNERNANRDSHSAAPVRPSY